MDLHRIAIIRAPWRAALPFIVAATMAVNVTAAWAGSDSPPLVTAQLQALDIQHMLNSLKPPRSLWHKTAGYSFCGACTSDSDCGTNNKCCTGDCTGNKKKCYAVATCADAK
ncbi:MAG: hypothetical protein KGJ66_03125 [Alphaproteobacteria bacterium]|nr:hypothetical protein [Alphaproteobacteria bacterium]